MEQIAEKKRAILKATLRLIGTHGFHGTPMSLVAKEAGVAAGTIYHYFDSKDTLICEVFRHVVEEVSAQMRLHIGEELSFREHIFRLWHNLYNYYSSNPDVLVFFEQFMNSPYRSTYIGNTAYDAIWNTLVCFMERGLEKGLLKPMRPEVLGLLLHSNVVTMVKLQRRGTLQLTPEELQQAAEVMWDGLRKV